MRRDLKILLGTLVCGGALLVYEHGKETMVEMQTFRVQEVDVRGVSLMERDEVVGLLSLEPTSSIWNDADIWIERLERHPMIKGAEVSRRFPRGLTVTVTERRPVA